MGRRGQPVRVKPGRDQAGRRKNGVSAGNDQWSPNRQTMVVLERISGRTPSPPRYWIEFLG
jgi:hypothetical protein